MKYDAIIVVELTSLNAAGLRGEYNPPMVAGSSILSDLIGRRWPYLILTVVLTILLAPSGTDRELVRSLRSAQIAVEAGQAQPALEALGNALDRHPDLHHLLPLAAEAALRSGELGLAREYLALADEFAIDPATSSCQWTRVHILTGDLDQARRSLQDTRFCAAALDMLRTAALEAFDQGDWSQAETAAVAALEHGSVDPDLEFLLIQLEAARQPLTALARLRDILDNLETPDALASDLLDTLRASLADPNQAFRLAMVGQVYARHGMWHLARLAFENAVALDPGYTQARAYYGLAMEMTGDNGREELLEAFRRDPKHPLPLAFLGNLWLEQGHSGRARALIQQAHTSDPQDPVLLVQLGAAQASAGDLVAAQDSLLKAVDLAPEQPEIWLALAQFSIHSESDLQGLGIRAGRQALLLDPGSAQAADLLGYAHLLQGRPTVARRLAQLAVQLDHRLTSAWYHLGLANLELGDIASARSALERAQSIEPNSATSELARRVLARLP